MKLKTKGLLAAMVGGLVAATTLAGCGSAPSNQGTKPAAAAPVKLLETGSSLLYPLFNYWVPDYQSSNPNVQITTASTGSGAGIAQASAGTVQIGASDAYMSDTAVKATPGILNIPLAISAQVVAYNVPGLNGTPLHFDGPTLAAIYEGKITKWNDAAIKAQNPGVNLPDQGIIAVHRTDGSGDSFIFTQYLSDTDPGWQNSVGFGVSPTWPAVSTAIGANGNPGMVKALSANPYSIAYVGISFQDQMQSAGLGIGLLKNHDGNYPNYTQDNILAAASQKVGSTPADERIPLINAPGANSYPIINYEYAIVNQHQASADVASAVKKFLTWASSPTGGNSSTYLNKVHFVPLPPAIVTLSANQIAKISG